MCPATAQAKPFRNITSIAHLAHGFLSGFISTNHFFISLFLYIQFVLYEFIEETKLRDEMYSEMMEWSTGFAIGLTVALLTSVFA